MRKRHFSTLAIFLLALVASDMPCLSADKNPTPGPKGGRLLENSAQRAEFIIGKDNRVTIVFYDENLKPVPAGGQVVSVSAEPKSGKISLMLEKKDGALVSKEPLPKPGFFDEYQITIQIKATEASKTESFKVRFDLDVCSKCKLQEYACICRR
jgi:hypothetical protein